MFCVDFQNNPALQSISGFRRLRTATSSLQIQSNGALASVAAFAQLNTIGTTLFISVLSFAYLALFHFDAACGFADPSLGASLQTNAMLATIDFPSLTTVGGLLTIQVILFVLSRCVAVR